MSMQSILAAGQSMAKMQALQSAKTQAQGQGNVLRIESKQDGGNERKDAQADELEEQSNTITGNLMGEATKAEEALTPAIDNKVEPETGKPAEEKPQETVKRPNVDIFEFSHSSGSRSETSPVRVAVSEPATYDADGIAMLSFSGKSAPALDITA